MHIYKQIRLFPEILFHAARHNLPATAYRLWFLAKHFDIPGCGFIPAKAFRQHLLSLGIPRQSLMRWIDQALAIGLLVRSGEVYAIASWQAGAARAGVTHLQRPACILQDKLLEKGWLATCWAAYLLHFNTLVSRQTLQELTSVPPRTQIAYEHQAGVVNHSNYANFGKVEDNPELAIQLYGQPGFYIRGGELFRRLPNDRNFWAVEGISLESRGRLKHINKALDQVDGSRVDKVFTLPLYSRCAKQTKRFMNKHRRFKGDNKLRPDFIYELHLQLRHCKIYRVLPL